MAGRPFYILFTEAFLCVLLFATLSVKPEVYESIQWSPDNPKFKFTKDQFTNGVAYYRQSVLLSSKISFICPNPRTVFGKREDPVANELLHENLWIVSKSSFDKCSIDKDMKSAKLLLQCQWQPGKFQYRDVIFQQYSASKNGLDFVSGQEYYFIATSDGLRSSLNNTSGGHCRDRENGVSMRVIFYICRNASECNTTAGGGRSTTETPSEASAQHSPQMDQRPCLSNGCNKTTLGGKGSPAIKSRKTAPKVMYTPQEPLQSACACTDTKITFGVVFAVSCLGNVVLVAFCCRKSSRINNQEVEGNGRYMNKTDNYQHQDSHNSGFELEEMDKNGLPAIDNKNSTNI